MKLFAFHDRKDDPGKGKGSHHALDLYAIIAMMTEPEYEFAKTLRTKYADNDKVREATAIIRQDFAEPGKHRSATAARPLQRRDGPQDVPGCAARNLRLSDAGVRTPALTA